MILIKRHTKSLTIILLIVQLLLPLSGSLYISAVASESEAGHTDRICAHTDSDAGHESQDNRGQVPHCHELDAPCETLTSMVVKHSPLVSPLTASYNGTFLHGYGAPLEIPPKNRV